MSNWHTRVRTHRKLPNADVTLAYPVDLKSVEPVQKHVNKCEQIIIPELNGIILLKLRHEWYTTISVWTRRNLTDDSNYILVFYFPPSNLDYFLIFMIWGIYIVIINVEFFGYCSKHYIFKKYFLRVDCPFKLYM